MYMACYPDGKVREAQTLEGFFLTDAVKAVGKAVGGVAKKVVRAVPKAGVGFITGGPGGAIAAGGASLAQDFLSPGGAKVPANTDPMVVADAFMRLRAQLAAREQAKAQASVTAGVPTLGGAAIPLALAAGVILLTLGRK